MVKNQKCPESPTISAAAYNFCLMGQDKILYNPIFNEITFTKSEVNFSTLERVYFTVQIDFRSLVYMNRLIFDEISLKNELRFFIDWGRGSQGYPCS